MITVNIHSFIHSFHKYLLSTHYVPGTGPGIENTWIIHIKKKKSFAFVQLLGRCKLLTCPRFSHWPLPAVVLIKSPRGLLKTQTPRTPASELLIR